MEELQGNWGPDIAFNATLSSHLLSPNRHYLVSSRAKTVSLVGNQLAVQYVRVRSNLSLLPFLARKRWRTLLQSCLNCLLFSEVSMKVSDYSLIHSR